MLDDGVYGSISEIGDAENISKSYVSRILRLALVAPDIVEAILAGKADQMLMLEHLERPLPASWEEQRRALVSGRHREYWHFVALTMPERSGPVTRLPLDSLFGILLIRCWIAI